MNALVGLPLLVPLAAATLGFLAWRHPRAQRAIGAAGALGLLAASALLFRETFGGRVLVLDIGGWPAPFGITLVADRLGALMTLLAGIIGAATAVYALSARDAETRKPWFFPMTNVLLTGVSGAFLTGDIFNLYVWFEVMLMGSFVLLVLGGGPGRIGGAIKYVVLNLVSSLLFLGATGALYGAARTLNLAELSQRMGRIAAEQPELTTTIALMFLAAYGIKAGLFPLFFWLPASYHTPPFAVSALFAGLLTKVGIYALLRVFALLFREVPFAWTTLLVLSGLTMIVGVIGAVAQREVRRILGFHIVSQIGYIAFGISLFGVAGGQIGTIAAAAAIFYTAHHIIVKANLFLVAGVMERTGHSEKLAELGGLVARAPWLALLFAVPAASLAGIPPLSGFWAKLAVIRSGLDAGEFLIVGAALVAGLLTVISMTKIWVSAFWKAPAEPTQSPATKAPSLWLEVGPIAILALITVLIGLYPGPLFAFAEAAAQGLNDPAAYLAALGGSR